MNEDALLSAAEALLAEGRALTISAVAERAGVARGTVYKRFPDRDALVAALVRTGRLAAGPADEPSTRARVLDAVAALLARQGLAGTTLDAVAREAEVGVATIYRLFGDRRGLYAAFAAERTPRRLAAELAPAGKADPEADLLRIARESIRFLREYRALFQAAQSGDPEAAEIFADLRHEQGSVRALTDRAVARLVPDPSGRASQAFQGMMVAIAWNTAGDAEEDARFVVRTLLSGARS